MHFRKGIGCVKHFIAPLLKTTGGWAFKEERIKKEFNNSLDSNGGKEVGVSRTANLNHIGEGGENGTNPVGGETQKGSPMGQNAQT